MVTSSLKLHSLADAITNSSDTIYTYSDQASVDGLKQVLGEILKACKVDGSVDAYFDVHLDDNQLVFTVICSPTHNLALDLRSLFRYDE